MILPIIIITGFVLLSGDNKIDNYLIENASVNIKIDANNFNDLIDDYRHKAYEISNSKDIIQYLSGEVDSSLIYEKLFSVLKGDTYEAIATIISKDGEIRLSTHLFPSRYDIRNHSAAIDYNNPLVDLPEGKTTKIYIANRYVTEKGNIVVLSFFRNIYDENDQIVGYTVIDILDSTITNLAQNRATFDELLLVQSQDYVAFSVYSPTIFDDYSKFPFINIRPKGEMKSGVFSNEDTVLALEQIGNTGLFLAGKVQKDRLLSSVDSFIKTILIITGFCILFALILAYHFANTISSPIKEVIQSMHQVEDGNLTIHISENSIREIDDLNNSFNNMVIQLVKLLQQLQENNKKTMEAERKSLESQLDPHFLFNTLNTIKSLARINGQTEIYQISLKLGSLLRSSLNNKSKSSTIRESVELIQSYLTIQEIRFVDKLKVDYDIDDSILDVVIPKFIIQPLVENSIKHGLEPKIGNWVIKIEIKKVDDRLVIKVIDNGVGIDNNVLKDDYSLLEETEHVGVYNIFRRLQINYDNKANFKIYRDEVDGYTIAEIDIPLSFDIAGLG
jgi:two-component system sensor histidine kinase YesM